MKHGLLQCSDGRQMDIDIGSLLVTLLGRDSLQTRKSIRLRFLTPLNATRWTKLLGEKQD